MSEGHDPPRLTRRQALRGAGGALGLAALGGGTFAAVELSRPSYRVIRSRAVRSDGPARVFFSRADLRPPAVVVAGADREVSPGHLFLGPSWTTLTQAGPMIIDRRGEPLWFKPLASNLAEANFRPWRYRGQPVLAWWEGTLDIPPGYGQGEAVIVDRSYRELARVRAADGRQMDFHELQLTPQGTALFTCFPAKVPVDLSPLGGTRDAHVFESVIQEVDLATGRLLFEWRSLDHIPVTESYLPLQEPYDYIHLNSIDVAPDGNLIVSGRHTWTVYKLDRQTGEVIWRLGGKRSDFQMGEGAQFSWQHDARQISERNFTVFDDGSDGVTNSERESRAVVLEVDLASRTVTLARSYQHPTPLVATSMGNVQALADGHVLVGWGNERFVSEFAADGTLIADAEMPPKQHSYRTYRFPWHGAPHKPPAIAAGRDPTSGAAIVYASWNGATEVTHWKLSTGPAPTRLQTVGIAKRHGFETAIPVPAYRPYAAVTALDHKGRRLADSKPISLHSWSARNQT
jgi:Arylsulfotransferase (ASST)